VGETPDAPSSFGRSLMPKTSSTSISARTAALLFSGLASALVVFLGVITAAPAIAATVEWSTPANLSEAGQSAGDHQIAIDGSGNVVAVWLRFDADSNRIAQSSWSDDGGASWTAPVNLSEPGEWASNVRVAVDGSGVGHAVWHRSDGSNTRVQYSRSVDGGVNWSDPVNLSTAGDNSQNPEFTLDGSGSLIAVWRGSNGDYDIIQSSRSTNSGASWSTPVDLSLTGQDANSPRVSADGSGNAVAVWRRSDGDYDIIQSSRSSNGGLSWSTPENLSESGQNAEVPRIAVDGSGNAVAVWRRSDGNDDIVQSSRLVAGGASWSTPVNVSPAGIQSATPRIAIDGSGNAVAVWRLADVGGTIIQSSRLAAGGSGWSTPEQLSVSGFSSDNPQVAANGSGNAVAVWQQSNGSNSIIRISQSTDGGASWTVPTDLSELGQSAITPEVAVDGSGNAVALWRRSNGENDIIQASFSSAIDGGGGGEELANTGAGGPVNDAALVASAGLLALGVLTRVFIRRRGVGTVR
jgi:hypothetical protein